jgi:hypothetical protein
VKEYTRERGIMAPQVTRNRGSVGSGTSSRQAHPPPAQADSSKLHARRNLARNYWQMADGITILAAICAAVCATLLFVESLQRPEHQTTWVYRCASKSWAYLDNLTSPSVIGGAARLLIDLLVKGPEYIAEQAFHAYGMMMTKMYGIVGRWINRVSRSLDGATVSFMFRDLVNPWVITNIVVTISLKMILINSWVSIALISFLLTTGALFSNFFAAILFAILVYTVIIVVSPLLFLRKTLSSTPPPAYFLGSREA